MSSPRVRNIASKVGFALLVVGLVALAVIEGRQGSLVPAGEAAPAFDLEKFDGGRVRLDELRGRLVMVDFWATWCGPCVAEMPYLTRIAQEYESKGLSFVAISQDDEETARADVALFLDKQVPALRPFVAFTSAEAARAFKVQALPTIYFVSPEGKIVASHRGQVSEAWVRKQVEEHLPR